MNFKSPGCIALAIVLTASAAYSAEAGRTNSSVGDLSIFVTLQRFRIYADHCSTKSPQLKPEFDSLMEDLGAHIRGISRGMLSADAFKSMKDKPVPAEIVFALEDSLNDAKHNLEKQDAGLVCPKMLHKLAEMDDETLTADLRQTLAAIQNMTRNLEKESAR